jgi:hypothetical protein
MTLAQIAFLFPCQGGLGALECQLVLAMQSLGLNPSWVASACSCAPRYRLGAWGCSQAYWPAGQSCCL